MKTDFKSPEISELEFARMWGTNGVVPDSSKVMLPIAYCEKERAEIAELNRIHALTVPSPKRSAHCVSGLKAILIDARECCEAAAVCITSLLGSIAFTTKLIKSFSVLSSSQSD